MDEDYSAITGCNIIRHCV